MNNNEFENFNNYEGTIEDLMREQEEMDGLFYEGENPQPRRLWAPAEGTLLDVVEESDSFNDVEEAEENNNIESYRNVENVFHYRENINNLSDDELLKLRNGFIVNKKKQFIPNYKEMSNFVNEADWYDGYISNISVVRRTSTTSTTTYYNIRINCHLALKDEVIEFAYEIPSSVRNNRPLPVLLVKMGIPFLYKDDEIHLDCLIGRCVSARLKKVVSHGKTIYLIDDLKPRAV